jgi:hypothetical protein
LSARPPDDVSKRDAELARLRKLWNSGVNCYLQPEHPLSRSQAMRVGDPPGAQLTVWLDADGERIAYQSIPRVM